MSLVNSLGSIEASPVAYRAMAGIGQCVAQIDDSILPFSSFSRIGSVVGDHGVFVRFGGIHTY
jgi:hypothetical protein